MDMMPLSQTYRSLSSPSRHAQQADEMLNLMLKQTDKSALIAKLNSGFFTQNTLHSLLHHAFLTESPDLVATMLTTRSYGADVLPHIIVESLNNAQEPDEQERFVSELLKDNSSKVHILTTAMHIAARRGMDLDSDRPLIGKLIKLSARMLSSHEALQIAHACADIGEFLLFVQLDRKNFKGLSTHVINEIEVLKEVEQEEMQLIPLTLSTIHPEIQMGISQFLEISDLLHLGQTSRGFNAMVEKALVNRTTCIRVSDLNDAAMATLRKVRCLDLMVDDVTDAKMEQIGRLPNLHTLYLNKGEVTEYGLQPLEKLTGLHALSLIDVKLQSRRIELQCLEKLANLHTLNFKGPRYDYYVLLQHLEKLPSLRALIWNSVLNSDDCSHLGKLTHLDALDLSHSTFMYDGWLHLGKLINLRALNLNSVLLIDNNRQPLLDLTDNMQHLGKITHLHTLDLSRTKVADDGLQHLEHLTQLHTLNLEETEITDAGLPHLEKLTHLHTLDLSFTAVTDDGIQHLGALTHLHTLDLSYTAVTDDGIQHLGALTHLHTLRLSGTKVRSDKKRYLKTILPNLRYFY